MTVEALLLGHSPNHDCWTRVALPSSTVHYCHYDLDYCLLLGHKPKPWLLTVVTVSHVRLEFGTARLKSTDWLEERCPRVVQGSEWQNEYHPVHAIVLDVQTELGLHSLRMKFRWPHQNEAVFTAGAFSFSSNFRHPHIDSYAAP